MLAAPISDIHRRKLGKIVLVILEVGILAYSFSLGLFLPHDRVKTLDLLVVIDNCLRGTQKAKNIFHALFVKEIQVFREHMC